MHKNNFGHVLILAGSPRMLGAACLTALAAMRSGAGLVTVGIPQSLNLALHKKLSPTVMTLPLAETKQGTLSLKAYKDIRKNISKYDSMAVGPGLGLHPQTVKLIRKIIAAIHLPLVIDADALNALSLNLNPLKKRSGTTILTPHPGEMARLTKLSNSHIEKNRTATAKHWAKKLNSTILLKGHHTVIANEKGKIFVNKTGNAGMATAGSGDVLTGMIAAFLAQGLSAFDSAKWGAHIHGVAGDLAAKQKTKLAMIATDIIDNIPGTVKRIINHKD